MENKTKIIATIGPASDSIAVLEQMILSGMNVARLNFSHGTYSEYENIIKNIRFLAEKLQKSVGILIDLQGPKIRTGLLKDKKNIMLETGGEIKITSRQIQGTSEIISTTYSNLSKDVKKNDTILLDDGLIELKVRKVDKDTVWCDIIYGGILKEHKGINLPGINVSASSLTEKDQKDLMFGIKAGVDFFALSFVRNADDLMHIKQIIKKHKANIPVIAKIEKPEAVDDLDNIIDIADCIMVARGDLGVEMKPEYVPTIQKRIIYSAIRANKPVITATQMLETMSSNPIPTRAESSDVANAIFDGTDAVMLSGETASGKYPVKAVQMMSRIAAETEKASFMKYNILHSKDRIELVTHAVAQSSVNIVDELDAKAIVVFSVSGKTSKLISKQRPSKPIYAFTNRQKVYNRLSIVCGVTPFIIPSIPSAKRLIEEGTKILIEKKLLKKGDIVVIVTGLALKSGSTNMIKIHKMGCED